MLKLTTSQSSPQASTDSRVCQAKRGPRYRWFGSYFLRMPMTVRKYWRANSLLKTRRSSFIPAPSSGARVQRAIARGVSVYQGDIDHGLADYPDQAFDYVILSQTLQETRQPLRVLREMLRVGRRAIVAFPNFGHWRVRLSMLTTGRAPKTRLFPYDWYDSPNIHFLTVDDFEQLARQEGLAIERRFFLTGRRTVDTLPNLRAEVAVFLVRK